MKRMVSILLVACSLIVLPLMGCTAEDNEKSAKITGKAPIDKPGEDNSPEGRKKQSMRGISPGAKPGDVAKGYPGR